jgi:hypothetical protein
MGDKSMITQKTVGKKKIISSSYFDDLSFLKKSEFETDYRDIKRNTNFDSAKLKLAYTVSKIIMWKKGCAELTAHVNTLGKSQLENIETRYLGSDWIEYSEPVIHEKRDISTIPDEVDD